MSCLSLYIVPRTGVADTCQTHYVVMLSRSYRFTKLGWRNPHNGGGGFAAAAADCELCHKYILYLYLYLYLYVSYDVRVSFVVH